LESTNTVLERQEPREIEIWEGMGVQEQETADDRELHAQLEHEILEAQERGGRGNQNGGTHHARYFSSSAQRREIARCLGQFRVSLLFEPH
jgi:hypothetical protein